MKKEEKRKIARLRKSAPTYFHTLKPSERKGFFKVEIEFLSYLELMCTITDLIKLCIEELYYEAEGSSPYITKNPSVQGILELVLQLLPEYEAELLDEIRPLLDIKKKETVESESAKV